MAAAMGQSAESLYTPFAKVQVHTSTRGRASFANAAAVGAKDKKANSRLKTSKSKTELRATAAATAFADLCSEMPPPPPKSQHTSSCAKQTSRKPSFTTKARLPQGRTSRLNAGTPYVVADLHSSTGGPSGTETESETLIREVTPEKLREELTSSKTLPLPKRKQLFLNLCRQWHPDKNPGNEEKAKILFQALQDEKVCFLGQ